MPGVGICGVVFGGYLYVVGVGVVGVQDLFGEADEGLVASDKPYIQI